ncbi:hypothetical protein F4803DRAFT_409403 [Xylaria telfairii]|nr:hypothetical protein F4803DRAFT_409403 [Xylaria telfairii]
MDRRRAAIAGRRIEAKPSARGRLSFWVIYSQYDACCRLIVTPCFVCIVRTGGSWDSVPNCETVRCYLLRPLLPTDCDVSAHTYAHSMLALLCCYCYCCCCCYFCCCYYCMADMGSFIGRARRNGSFRSLLLTAPVVTPEWMADGGWLMADGPGDPHVERVCLPALALLWLWLLWLWLLCPGWQIGASAHPYRPTRISEGALYPFLPASIAGGLNLKQLRRSPRSSAHD